VRELMANQSIGVIGICRAQQRLGQRQQGTTGRTAERQLREQIGSRATTSMRHASGQRDRQPPRERGLRLIDTHLAQ
jgi:hypothetical protein